MKHKSLAVCLLAYLSVGLWCQNLGAADSDNIKIGEITVEQVPMPKEINRGGGNKVLDEDWHVIEVKFSTNEELTDEIQVKFFLEAFDSKKEDQFVILTSEVTFINVPKGENHVATAYLAPGSLLRYVGKKART
ncbi:MAG: hypothetical protein HC904_07885 [Blastochloris sp.]|nr:hypothetical protein [Blastochloris sp.]